MGSVYLILATNLGARLGLPRGAGRPRRLDVPHGHDLGRLRHRPAAARSRPGRPSRAHRAAGQRRAVQRPACSTSRIEIPADATSARGRPQLVDGAVRGRGVDDASAPRSRASARPSSAAGDVPRGDRAFAAGEFQAVNVFDIGGERLPDDRRVRPASRSGTSRTTSSSRSPPLEPTRDRGRPRAGRGRVVDETRQHQYVYMVRDLGTRRQPAFVLIRRRRPDLRRRCAGSCTAVSACSTTNRSTAPVPAG